MKTTLEKVLLGICVCLLLVSGMLITYVTVSDLEKTHILFNLNTYVPNSKKFEKTQEDLLGGETNIGDGTYQRREFYPPASLSVSYVLEDESVRGDTILHDEIAHKFENEIFYGYFEDGYAIVYPESNLCKVLRVSRSDYPEGRSVDYEENPDGSYTVKKVEIESGLQKHLIVYIDSFEEFTPYEQRMLEGLVTDITVKSVAQKCALKKEQ